MSDAAKTRVLVVEDEPSIQRGLCDVLAFHGYEPRGVESGEEGLREALGGSYALVLLDVMLPGRNGFDVCRELRAQQPEQAILMLTARGSEDDILNGFRCGSDDYVTKPFSVAELMARVAALLRRRSGDPDSEDPESGAEPFEIGPWRVHPQERRADRDGVALKLSRLEVGVLALFARERGRIVSRRTLLREVWGMRAADRVETRTVDMHIAKLRKKIGANAIETVRGEGYRYAG
jgi:DNA-binding response OmpR family regulator